MRIIMLQWGHACEGVETRKENYQKERIPCFNGATPVKAWKPILLFKKLCTNA